MPAKKTRAKKAQAKKKPARKTQAKKAQAKKKPARKTQAKEILSPDTPPADGRSPFTQLPLEIHMVIGDMLKEDKRLDALPTLARTSRRLCSFYEQQLYKGKDNTHRVKALMWGVAHDSVTVMKSARQWGADLNVRSYHLDRKRSRRNNYISGKGTALQFAIRDGHNESMCWLLDERARVDIPGKPAWGMCQCGSYSRSYASSLHLAFCNGNLLAATILLRRAPEASVQYSRKVDTGSILKTAVKAAFGRYSVRFLDVALENPAIRKSINAFQEEDLHTPLALALSPEYEGDDLLEPILAALVKAGASLGPYPQGSHMEGHSPLLLLLDRGDRESATYLLRLGCDPNGDRPHPVTPAWQSPLHFYINPESHNRWSTPAWHQQVFHRWRLTPREFIVVLLEHGASLDITNAEGVSPLDNAISFMARYVAPRRRVAGFKLVKLLLANVKPEGISTKSRERAEGVMTTLVQDLRAEHATHNLSDVRDGMSGGVKGEG
ncbi:hypothetical protein B0H65DRAFT_547036 [Neurospora tetraspora]|uniref:Ankyrin n=1 Tax=Neurospora tetraspora TaxID=94610 RepID=A0AAE0JLT0_9PEZI|nr:hypothetical protein B0H65DRAFT_547036 [Neurospora tetraspora]